MKSLDALKNIVIRTAIPYFLGVYGNDQIEDLKTIKQDLEVLELLKKKIKFTYDDHFTGVIIEGKEENYDKDTIIFSQEEYEKVYKWLEEE